MDNPVTISPSSEKRKRLPTLKRAAPAELPGFRLTPRDQEIIQAVYAYRALTTPQIEALFFPSAHKKAGAVNARCKHRLRMLYHHGYLFRDEQPQKLSEGRKPLIYFLELLGGEFISQQLESEEIDWDPVDNDVSQPFLAHLLATNDVRVAVSVAAGRQGMRVAKWLDDRTLRSPQTKQIVTVRGPDGSQLQAAVIPDGYFVLEAGEFLYHHFLEIDLRTVTAEASKWGRRDWSRKVRAYLEYYRSGKYAERYGTQSLRILTVTTGDRRLGHLKAISQRVLQQAQQPGETARFWFTTFALATPENILTKPIWQVAGEEALRSLIW